MFLDLITQNCNTFAAQYKYMSRKIFWGIFALCFVVNLCLSVTMPVAKAEDSSAAYSYDWNMSAYAQNYTYDYDNYWADSVRLQGQDEYRDTEQADALTSSLARGVIQAGRSLESGADAATALNLLLQNGHLFSAAGISGGLSGAGHGAENGESSVLGDLLNFDYTTQRWVDDRLTSFFDAGLPGPHDNTDRNSQRIRDATLRSLTKQIAQGAGRIGRNIQQDITSAAFGDGQNSSQNTLGLSTGLTALGIDTGATQTARYEDILQETLLSGGIESLRAALQASGIEAFRKIELDYTLSSGGIDTYSILTVLPIFESPDLRDNVFVQASLFNTDGRDTANLGIAYRQVADDQQSLWGVNAFLDHQWPYNHARLSLGFDYRTPLYGASLNQYFGLTGWKDLGDGYEERALGGQDIELSGRVPQLPELELFLKGFHWVQDRTPVLNPSGRDIFGYEIAAEYTPVNAFTFRAAAIQDNDSDGFDGQLTMRLNYTLGQDLNTLWDRPTYNLDNVLDRRFEKVRRTNEIRVQERQNRNNTAVVIFAQGANVALGQGIAFGNSIITGNAAGDAVTAVFGNGAVLNVGQNTQVRLEQNQIVLVSGLIQYISASGGIRNISTPGGTIELLGTDVDILASPASTTLRVRDGASNFTDDTGTTFVNLEQVAISNDGDGIVPQIIGVGDPSYDNHVALAHQQLSLIAPVPNNNNAAPYVNEPVTVAGTFASGSTITFDVPVTQIVNVTGSPILNFTLGGSPRMANYSAGDGSQLLQFTYVLTPIDVSLSNIIAIDINLNGGSLLGNNGAPIVRQISGGSSTLTVDVTPPVISSITASGSSGSPAVVDDVITVTIDANEDLVFNSGSPSLTLDIGGVSRTANYAGLSAGNAQFTYTVQASDADGDGITVTALNIPADSLEDSSGNDLDIVTGVTLPQNLGIDIVQLILGLFACPAGDLSAPTNAGCARQFGADPTSTDDVMVYAGDVPGTTTDFFIRRCDLGQAYDPVDDRCELAGDPNARTLLQWKDNGSNSVVADIGLGTPATDAIASDGPANTAALVADASGTHFAVEACDALPGGGWYMPAFGELDVAYANLIGTDDPEHPLPGFNQFDNVSSSTTGPLRSDFLTDGTWYWTSNDTTGGGIAAQRFNDGGHGAVGGAGSRPSRCARR